jgi:hypothetical protein
MAWRTFFWTGLQDGQDLQDMGKAHTKALRHEGGRVLVEDEDEEEDE